MKYFTPGETMTDKRGRVIDPDQHCHRKNCFTFSHTANYCGRLQKRRCACAFCYPTL